MKTWFIHQIFMMKLSIWNKTSNKIKNKFQIRNKNSSGDFACDCNEAIRYIMDHDSWSSWSHGHQGISETFFQAKHYCFYGLISDDFCAKFSKVTTKSDNWSNKTAISMQKSVESAVYWNKNGSFRLHRLENCEHGAPGSIHYERLLFFEQAYDWKKWNFKPLIKTYVIGWIGWSGTIFSIWIWFSVSWLRDCSLALTVVSVRE